MIELACHYCHATVAVIAKGKRDKNAVHLCGECARQRVGIEKGTAEVRSCGVVDDLFKMMGMRK